jgi:hypothetical protein
MLAAPPKFAKRLGVRQSSSFLVSIVRAELRLAHRFK